MRKVTIALAVFGVCAFAKPQGPPDIPEECRPQGPPHEREVCCQMPRPSQQLREEAMPIMQECANMLGMPAHGPHGPPPHGPPPPGPPPPGPPPQGPPPGHPHNGTRPNMPCLQECLFNKLGLLTAEMKLDSAALTARALQEFGSEAAWAPVVQEAAKACSQSAATSVPEDASCTSGAAEFNRCLMRTMYMNCPSNLKSNTDTCAAEMERMARCPFLRPPPPPRPQ